MALDLVPMSMLPAWLLYDGLATAANPYVATCEYSVKVMSVFMDVLNSMVFAESGIMELRMTLLRVM